MSRHNKKTGHHVKTQHITGHHVKAQQKTGHHVKTQQITCQDTTYNWSPCQDTMYNWSHHVRTQHITGHHVKTQHITCLTMSRHTMQLVIILSRYTIHNWSPCQDTMCNPSYQNNKILCYWSPYYQDAIHNRSPLTL